MAIFHAMLVHQRVSDIYLIYNARLAPPGTLISPLRVICHSKLPCLSWAPPCGCGELWSCWVTTAVAMLGWTCISSKIFGQRHQPPNAWPCSIDSWQFWRDPDLVDMGLVYLVYFILISWPQSDMTWKRCKHLWDCWNSWVLPVS